MMGEGNKKELGKINWTQLKLYLLKRDGVGIYMDFKYLDYSDNTPSLD